MPWKNAIIGGGMNILGKGIDALFGNMSQQQELENIRKLRQEENVYNHPAAQRARMEQAGYSAFAGDVSPGVASTTTDAPYNKALDNMNFGQSGSNLMNLLSSASNLLNDDMQRQNLAKELERIQADILLKQAQEVATKTQNKKLEEEIDKIRKESSWIAWQESRARSLFDKEKDLLEQNVIRGIFENQKISKELEHYKKTGQWIGTQTDNIITILRHYLPELAEEDLRKTVLNMYLKFRNWVNDNDDIFIIPSD